DSKTASFVLKGMDETSVTRAVRLLLGEPVNKEESLIKHKTISVFEHQRLFVGEQNFKQIHLDALLKLNEYHNGNYFEPIAKGVKFNQYVGVIQVDGLTIEIHPKADKEDDDRKWKGVLIKMLKACGKLKAETNGAAHVR